MATSGFTPDKKTEVAHQLRNTSAQALLVHPSLLKTAIEAAKEVGLPKDRVYQFSDTENSPSEGISDWRAMLGSESEGSSYRWPKLNAEQSKKTIATINYSSGTTGLPKGVCVSHSNLIANVEQCIFSKYDQKPFNKDNHPPERWVGFLPLYHAYGQLYTILTATKLQIPVYIMKAFVYTDFLSIIQHYKITHLHVAPPIVVMLSKRPETANYDISTVTDMLCGAAPLSKELQNDVSSRYGIRIIQAWGMTEVTCGGTSIPGGVFDNSGSVGPLLANGEGKLLDDDGKEVGVGEPGEIYIRGPQVCMGYWRNEAATREAISEDGWLKTGDMCVRDERGYFWIVDRKKACLFLCAGSAPDTDVCRN